MAPGTALELHVLQSIANADPVAQILADVCRGVEGMVEGAIVGISILDRAACVFESAVFPSLGESFESGIRGARVADKPGTCAVAIYNGEVVTSQNVADDTRFWNEWRALNLQHGIRSIQSRPFFSPEGIALGTFVAGFREQRALGDFEEQAFALGARLSALALTRHRHDERLNLLIGELQHRTRNLFASVRAIFQMSLKSSPDLTALQRTFDGRLAALIQAQTLATEPGGGADLKTLLEAIVAPYARPGNIALRGPSVLLAPEPATAFALSLHELATNAAKYGALSSERGRLTVAWDVAAPDGGPARFSLTWQETGGPEVTAPTKSGFGRRTIESSLAHAVDAKISVDFRKEGLVCAIDAPMQRMTALRPVNWSTLQPTPPA